MKKMLTLAVLLLALPRVSFAQTDELGTEQVSRLGLEQRWSTQAVINTNRDKVSHVVNDEDNIYLQTSAGVVTAINAENGRILWSSQVGVNDDNSRAAVSNSKILLICTGPVVQGLDKFTGDELFSYRLPAQPSASPGMDDSSFYLPMIDGSVGAFSIRTLKHYERYGALPAGVPRAMAWRYICNETIRFAPVVGEQSIAFGTDLGNIHAASTSSGALAGRPRFEILTKSSVTAPMTYTTRASEELIISVSENNRVFCLNLNNNGKLLWTYAMGRRVTQPMPVFGESVFVVTDGEGMWQLSVVTGQPVRLLSDSEEYWNVPDVNKLLAVSKEKVYVLDNANRVLSVKRSTGEVEANVSTADYSIQIRNSLTDRLYLATATGRVICLAEKGSAFATYHQHPERQPIMPDVPNQDPAAAPAAEGEATP